MEQPSASARAANTAAEGLARFPASSMDTWACANPARRANSFWDQPWASRRSLSRSPRFSGAFGTSSPLDA